MNNRYEWTYIADNPVVVDLSCKGSDYHKAIEDALGFPEYYGRNWDACWDLFQDFCMSYPEGKTIILRNFHVFDCKDRQIMLGIISDAQKDYPHITILTEE